MKGYQFIVSISVIFCLLVPLISNGDAHLNVEYPIPVVEETVEQFKNSFPVCPPKGDALSLLPLDMKNAKQTKQTEENKTKQVKTKQVKTIDKVKLI